MPIKPTSKASFVKSSSKPNLSKAEQLALIEANRKDDKSSLDKLFKNSEKRIKVIISRYINDPDTVQDVYQEACIKAIRGLEKFRGDSEFHTWFYRIAVNAAKNLLKKQRHQPQNNDMSYEQYVGIKGEFLSSEFVNPLQLLEQSELGQDIVKALNSMPEDLRITLELREFDLLSYQEIADATESPIGTVRSRIARARELIDTCLDLEGYEIGLNKTSNGGRRSNKVEHSPSVAVPN